MVFKVKKTVLVFLSLMSISWMLSTVNNRTLPTLGTALLNTGVSSSPIPSESSEILIVTMFRSGSSFVADLFSHHPGVFYVFEPFLLNQRISQNVTVAAEILLDIHNCSFDSIRRISTWTSDRYLPRVFCTKRHRLIEDKQNNFKCGQQIFKKSNWIHSVCKEYKHVVTKSIRIFDVGILMKLLDNGIKIIHLVRDPRGRFNSMSKGYYTSTKICSKQERFLHTIRDQLKKCNPSFRKNYFLVRYEDIARSPLKMTKMMYRAVGLDFQPEVAGWIAKSTVLNKGGPSSTMRNSSSVWNAWRRELNWSKIKRLQTDCEPVLSQLGYALMSSKGDLSTVNPLLDFPEDSILHEKYLG